MIKTIVAAIAAISSIMLAGPGRGSVQHPRKTFAETPGAILIAYTPGKSTSRFWIFGNQHIFENRSPAPLYICGKDNSRTRGMKEVMA